MKLSEKEANLFFELIWSLQYFVNSKLKIHPEITDVNDYSACDTEQKVEVRQALYEHIEIIDDFIEVNPQHFSKENLSIILSWKNYIGGNFYIERFLKKHAVFIQEEKVYGVLGLQQRVDELVHRPSLPLYVNAILLPFKGKIIYDGLLGHHNIYFGGGLKCSLKEIYMRAKQNNRIINTLEVLLPKEKNVLQGQSLKNWKPKISRVSLVNLR